MIDNDIPFAVVSIVEKTPKVSVVKALKILRNAAGITAIFSGGMVAGSSLVAWHLKKMSPIMHNAIANIIHKAVQDDLSLEEVQELCQQEIDFIKIARNA